MTTKRTLFFLKTLKFLQRDKDKTQLQPEQSLRAAKRKNKAAVLMVVSISLCVCDISYSAAAISLAWLSFFLAKHWTGPVYSTLAPIEFYRSCPKKSGRTWVCHGEWKTPAQTFEMCYKQELVMQSVALFFPPNPNSDRVGSSWPVGYGTWSRTMRWGDWRGRAAWIHMGTGQDRQAGSACHSTAEGRDGSRRF